MKVHHLNCATLCPIAGGLLGPPEGERTELVCHCLLIETEAGLVLVDTGFGLDDLAHPKARLGGMILRVLRPRFEASESALRQVEALGFERDDVRHVVVTHLDLDHAGGLGDFPKARVHLYAPEREAAISRASSKARRRYRPAHFAHGPDFRPYEVAGERWFGFGCVRELEGLPPELLLVPLVGHSAGHCAVAVDTGEGWLLHCGDAYFHREEMGSDGKCPFGFRVFQRLVAWENRARCENQERLRELRREHGDAVRLFCAHDPVELRGFD